MVKALGRPEKESFLLVTFYHGENFTSQELYTDWDQETSGHQPVPNMEVVLPANTGTFDKQEARILMPVDDFTGNASNGLPHSPILVKIVEVTQGLFVGDQNAERVRFRGRIMRTVRNHQGRANVVAFFALPPKARLDVSMGLPCNHQCVWNLFGQGCGLNRLDFELQTEIDSVDGQVVTITDGAITAQVGTYWRRGYLEKDGLRIMIRDWSDADPTQFYMTRRVPDSWVAGADDITAVPGCDKNISTCRDRYANEENFMGPGFAIPAYQPIIESGQ